MSGEPPARRSPAPWLVAATWVVWPWVGRSLARVLVPGTLEMRADAAGNDVEFLVHSPLERAGTWLLVLGVPVLVTVAWWLRRARWRARCP